MNQRLKFPQSPEGSYEAGFSIAGALIFVGVLGVTALVAYMASTSTDRLKKDVANRAKMHDLEFILLPKVTSTFNQRIQEDCQNMSIRDVFPDLPLTPIGNSEISHFVPRNSAGFDECRRPRIGQPDGEFFFCLRVSRDREAPEGSILRASNITMEIFIKLKNTITGQALTCAEFLDGNPENGAAYYYTSHWKSRGSSNQTIRVSGVYETKK